MIEDKKVRLSKRMSELGFCSRRDAEVLIKKGKIRVNNVVVTEPYYLVDKADLVNVSGEDLDNLKNSKIRLFVLNKPAGYVVSKQDELGRKTIYDLIPKEFGRLIYVGRLDLNSEGVLLLTNSGEFSRKLELPKTGIVRTYHVRAFGFLDEKKLVRMQKGVVLDGVSYQPKSLKIHISEQAGKNKWFEVKLTTGKNREIKKYFEHFGLTVNRLIRVSYGPFDLEKIPLGGIAEVKEKTLAKFIESL